MPILAIKNQAETRWFTFGGVAAVVLRQVVRFAKIASGGMTHWSR
jgi:hypothetical protein